VTLRPVIISVVVCFRPRLTTCRLPQTVIIDDLCRVVGRTCLGLGFLGAHE